MAAEGRKRSKRPHIRWERVLECGGCNMEASGTEGEFENKNKKVGAITAEGTSSRLI